MKFSRRQCLSGRVPWEILLVASLLAHAFTLLVVQTHSHTHANTHSHERDRAREALTGDAAVLSSLTDDDDITSNYDVTKSRTASRCASAGDDALQYLLKQNKLAAQEVHRLVDLRKDVPQAVADAKAASLRRRHECALCRPRELTVASYNIWGVRQNWTERWPVLTRAVGGVSADILLLQEVMKPQRDTTQAHLLADALDYPHVYYARAHKADAKEGGEEGLAIVSKFEASHAYVIKMKRAPNSPDLNERVFIHAVFPRATVEGRETGQSENGTQDDSVHVIAAHFTYHPQAQCDAILQLLLYINKNIPRGADLFLGGDLNTYMSYEWPMGWLTNDLPPSLRFHARNPCAHAIQALYAHLSLSRDAVPGHLTMQDSFVTLHPRDPGWTFTNMEYTSHNSLFERATRPDRILRRSVRYFEHSAWTFADAVDGYVSPKLYASDHRGLAISYVALPDTWQKRTHDEKLFFIRYPSSSALGQDALPPRRVTSCKISGTVKPTKSSPALQSLLESNPRPLHFDLVSPNQAILVKLDTPTFLTRIRLRAGCEPGFPNAPAHVALEVQLPSDEKSKWRAIRVFKDTTDMLWSAALGEQPSGTGHDPVSKVRVRFVAKTGTVSLCALELEV